MAADFIFFKKDLEKIPTKINWQVLEKEIADHFDITSDDVGLMGGMNEDQELIDLIVRIETLDRRPEKRISDIQDEDKDSQTELSKEFLAIKKKIENHAPEKSSLEISKENKDPKKNLAKMFLELLEDHKFKATVIDKLK